MADRTSPENTVVLDKSYLTIGAVLALLGAITWTAWQIVTFSWSQSAWQTSTTGQMAVIGGVVADMRDEVKELRKVNQKDITDIRAQLQVMQDQINRIEQNMLGDTTDQIRQFLQDNPQVKIPMPPRKLK